MSLYCVVSKQGQHPLLWRVLHGRGGLDRAALECRGTQWTQTHLPHHPTHSNSVHFALGLLGSGSESRAHPRTPKIDGSPTSWVSVAHLPRHDPSPPPELTSVLPQNSYCPSLPRPCSSNSRSILLWQTHSTCKQTRPANLARFHFSETLLGPSRKAPAHRSQAHLFPSAYPLPNPGAGPCKPPCPFVRRNLPMKPSFCAHKF